MPLTPDSDICSQELGRDEPFSEFEVQVQGIFWSKFVAASVGCSGYVLMPGRQTRTWAFCKSSKRTSSTMADAGLNTSVAALAFTLAVMRADNAAPTSAGWLWRLEPI